MKLLRCGQPLVRSLLSIRIPVSWITSSRGFLVCSKSLQTRSLHRDALKCILECVHILQNTSKFSKDTKCLPGIATLIKCSPQTTCKCFPQQRKYFTHTANSNLWATSWFWFQAKQLRNTLCSDCARAVLQNIWGMNLSSTGTSKISPGGWIEPGEAEQKLLCCHTCMPPKTSCVLGKQSGLAADTALHREGDQKRWWGEKGELGWKNINKTSVPLCVLVSHTSWPKWVPAHPSRFQIPFSKGAEGSGIEELGKDVSIWKGPKLTFHGHLPCNSAVDAISFPVSAEGCSYHAGWTGKSMGDTLILKTPCLVSFLIPSNGPAFSSCQTAGSLELDKTQWNGARKENLQLLLLKLLLRWLFRPALSKVQFSFSKNHDIQIKIHEMHATGNSGDQRCRCSQTSFAIFPNLIG